ncbi:retrovirus-related Pol polyprotein from transposon opus [Trichonephila clavipes]|nr:retrovirus-related Pol polyprotein from transposon opus [Trichonephila clavipes]
MEDIEYFTYYGFLGAIVLVVIFNIMQSKKKNLPPGPFNLPFVGYLPFLGQQPHITFKKLTEKYGPVFSLRLGMAKAVVITNYDIMKETFSKSETLSRPPNFAYSMPDELGLTSVNGHEWVAQRKYTIKTMGNVGLGKSKWQGFVQFAGSVLDALHPQQPFLLKIRLNVGDSATGAFTQNAPSTFQRFINEVLFGLEFVFPYLYDILVASENKKQHRTHLKLVFDRLQKYGLRVNLSKSTLGVTHLEFLGFLITLEGSKPLTEKVDAILSYKLPETIRDLRTFLGLINCYRRYLKDAAKNQVILHEYLKDSKKNDKTKIVWTEEDKENFEKCKQDLAHATLLSFPGPDLQLAFFTDASNFEIGSVLQQFEAGN